MSAPADLAPGLDRAERAALADAARHAWLRWFPLGRTKERSPTEPLDREAWRGICGELELPGLGLPVELGGAGLGIEHLAAIAESAGATLAPAPWLSTVAVIVPVLAELCPDELGPVLSGDSVMAVVHERAGDAVPWGADADRFVLLREDGTAALAEGSAAALAVVDATRPQGRVTLTGVRELGRVDGAARVRDERVLAAAEAIGSAAEMLDRTLAYVKVRQQFGHPIGSFQAVQHRLADFYGEIESATAAVRGASAALDRESSVVTKEKLSLVAWLRASEVATLIGRECLHLHGGIGFTWEHDAHLFYKRALLAQASYGGPAGSLRRLADLIG